MNHWRISKYNPKLREDGSESPFAGDEWTTVEDVGSEELSRDEYIKIENLYVDACVLLAMESEIATLNVKDYISDGESDGQLKKHGLELSAINKHLLQIEIDELPIVVRQNLRGIVYCKLEAEDSFYIHFGYDFYMYIGSIYDCRKSIRNIELSGLYVEPFESPYL